MLEKLKYKWRRFKIRRKVEAVSEALGQGLADWQIDYIFLGEDLPSGCRGSLCAQTVALKQILQEDSKYYWRLTPVSSPRVIRYTRGKYRAIGDDRGDRQVLYHRNYLFRWKKLYSKLHEAGIPVAEVLWS